MPRQQSRSARIRQSRRIRMQQRRARPIRKYQEIDDNAVSERAGEIAAQEAAQAVIDIDPSTYQEIIDIEARLDALEQP